MIKDILRDNIDCYLGSQARKDWSADSDLYSFEIEIIETFFGQCTKILDLGCGAGRTTLGLEQRGYDVDAIDLSQDLVEEACKRLTRSRVHRMDARHLEFANRSFDAAMFSFNGLDCVYPSSERHRVLTDVYRVLRPGGVFYYSGHNGLGTWAPRPGDSPRTVVKRNAELLLAQRRRFAERSRYLAYPEANGTQVLYSALPHVHLRELRAVGFEPIAVYGVRGPSFRIGPHVIRRVDLSPWRWRTAAVLGQLSLGHPHLHYVARKPAD